ncbi:hypothetical protein AB9P05_07100 [Roseivirga sp. BDSF3-8]|uniref:hypothetical protein n=1 Tax=Roseivirga sp. BDSF3-8 TaxID=3241598 RepID=UPI0035323A5C
MNAAHWHLVLNHIPVLGTFFAAGFLVAGIFGSSKPIKKAGLIVLLLSAGMVIPVVATGEEAEEIVEKQGVSHELIHEHEEQAETAQWLMVCLGGLALVSIIADGKNRKLADLLFMVCLIGSVAIGIVLVKVATTGGQISHPEIHALG